MIVVAAGLLLGAMAREIDLRACAQQVPDHVPEHWLLTPTS
ncbi:hypothetical protein [Modestobacter italicus]|nr:hypothetical protein [Modestobacter marinus]